MHPKLLSVLFVASLALACGDGDAKDTDKVRDPTDKGDAGTPGDDAGPKSDKDSGAPQTDCDKPETPGNDCSDAVGCREAPSCGLNTSSCCVPGFDVENVKCIDGIACEGTAGRASCDGPEDCGGRACCVDIAQGTTGCFDSCGTKLGLCHTDADCESPKVCSAGGSFTWWGVCN